MANNNDSERHAPPRLPRRLVIAVLLLGTLLAWWGTRDHRLLFGDSPREPVAAGVVILPRPTEEESVLLNRGSEISTQRCAGCHEMARRSTGPSYQEILTFYRGEFPASTSNPELRSRLASAVTHPRPGWGNFPPGPFESELSVDDRIALATWILDRFDRGNHGK